MTEPQHMQLRKIEEALIKLDIKPLLKEFSINLEEVQKKLSLLFEQKDFTFTIYDQKICTKQELKESFVDEYIAEKITLSPLNGEVFWIMDKKDIATLTSKMLTEPPISDLSSEFLQEGFYHFICLHALEALQSEKNFSDFNLKLEEEATLLDEAYLTKTLAIKFSDTTLKGILVFSKEFLKSFNHHLAKHPPLFQKMWEQNLELPLTLTIGKTSIDQATYHEMEKGDFLVMDRLSFNPKSEKSLATLTLGDVTLFHVKVKVDKIKVLDFGFTYEETMEEEEIFEEKPEKTKEEKLSSLENFPLEICVELGRLSMPLSKIFELQPGNFIELPGFDTENVSITIKGKTIGKGEIVQLGEAAGIRILELFEK